MTALQPTPPTMLSDRDMAALGLQEMAYVKPVVTASGVAYAVHAADGTEIAVMPNRDVAFATIRQNDLRPVSVH